MRQGETGREEDEERRSRNPAVEIQVEGRFVYSIMNCKPASRVLHIVDLLSDYKIYQLTKLYSHRCRRLLDVGGILDNIGRGSMQQVYFKHSYQKYFSALCGFTYSVTN